MASDADAYERGVKISQTSLTPNFREGVQANPWFQLGYQMGLKHGGRAAGMMSQAKSEFPQVAARLSASRPGQPERFDASSLNRADFSDASKSPILGKLLAAKAMPDGGWRAVQAGSDTLVISFEDGDVAGDFGKRAASKGFNATSPVQAIGRYWNVEVKNGK